jgi:hypothetical protein
MQTLMVEKWGYKKSALSTGKADLSTVFGQVIHTGSY